MEASRRMTRVIAFDIEASSLNASFGHLLCFGYQDIRTKHAKVLRIDQYPAATMDEPIDYHLVKAIHGMMEQDDIFVSWYGTGYDWPFLKTRIMLAGLSPMPPLKHVDLYYTCRANLKLHSNRLQGASETLGCPLSKTPVRADIWLKAQRGDLPSLAYVAKHCKLDVEILTWVYHKLSPYVRQHPHVSTREACRGCGGATWQSRGITTTVGGVKKRRIQCQGCGRWDQTAA